MPSPRTRLIALLLAMAIALSACPGYLVYRDKAGAFGIHSPGERGTIAVAVAGDIFEVLLAPFMLLVDVGTFRFLWDHGSFPFSGLVGMIVRALCILPGFVYTDVWPFRPMHGPGTYNPFHWLAGAP